MCVQDPAMLIAVTKAAKLCAEINPAQKDTMYHVVKKKLYSYLGEVSQSNATAG
jgi:hypothetical protein